VTGGPRRSGSARLERQVSDRLDAAGRRGHELALSPPACFLRRYGRRPRVRWPRPGGSGPHGSPHREEPQQVRREGRITAVPINRVGCRDADSEPVAGSGFADGVPVAGERACTLAVCRSGPGRCPAGDRRASASRKVLSQLPKQQSPSHPASCSARPADDGLGPPRPPHAERTGLAICMGNGKSRQGGPVKA